MTTANASHTRPGGTAQAWQTFRRWQRSRPFWGGLFIALAGVAMFASTRMTINGLSFHSGATGLLSLLIPVILVTCALLLWLSPAQRLFYSVVAAVTTVYSLIGLNLGGFFVGLLLGIVGSALAFAWTPIRPAPAAAELSDTDLSDTDLPLADQVDAGQAVADQPGADQADAGQADARQGHAEQSGVERLDTERIGVEQVDAADEPVDRPAGGATDVGAPPEWPGRSADPRVFGVALLVLGLAAAGLATQPRAVQAAPTRPAATACPSPSRSVTPSPSPTTPTGTPTPTPSASPERDGNIITDILDGIGDLFTGGRGEKAATPSATPTASASAKPTATPTARPGSTACPSPKPGGSGKPGATTPDKPEKAEPGKPLPRIAADPNLPMVGQTPSKLTGSKVTMTGLRFDGTTELQTEKGSLKVLKFSMREAVTDDFLLVADGPDGRTQRYKTDRLTVRGNVAFYSTRFVGKLLGIKLTLTPDLPLPDGIPVTLPISITFTDPVMDLAYVTSDTLTARPSLALALG
ncbi:MULTISPECIES: DUF6114 domain-containing protein [unclassified Micromonospora]|uniref:DUF6114 domain-containing protein n=1 Tax=unclassified Micromonospora TaxID=2617518 RepID=UPI001B36BFEF|nr:MULTISPECIES: DUF6114 domain-containing protein [unclassified Micromonospora]MBQ0980834.1 hypothetical protein [Micromonospora sp. M61]MBQ1035822.1 hypothetical protein [Micromonospora sp. C81]